jgi:hypothetical protein
MVRLNKQNNSIVDWRTLRARKAYLGLRNEDLMRAADGSSRTVSAFLAGDEKMNLDTIIRLATVLGLSVKITFEVVKDGVDEAVYDRSVRE